MSRSFRRSYGSPRFPRWFCSTSQDESTLVTESPVFAKAIAFERCETIVDVRCGYSTAGLCIICLRDDVSYWNFSGNSERRIWKCAIGKRKEETVAEKEKERVKEKDSKRKLRRKGERFGNHLVLWSPEDGCRTRADYWDLTIDLTYGNPLSIYSD